MCTLANQNMLRLCRDGGAGDACALGRGESPLKGQPSEGSVDHDLFGTGGPEDSEDSDASADDEVLGNARRSQDVL